MNFLDARNSTSALAPEPSSSVTISPWRARRALLGALHRASTRRPADLAGVDADVGERPGLQRLLLRRHDPLEGGVAGLAGLVGHREHQRRGRADHLGGGVAVALDPDLLALALDHRAQRDLREVEALGQHRRDHRAGRVGRGHAAHHQVDRRLLADLLDRGRPAPARCEVVGAGDRVVDDVDALVGAHLQRLLDRVGGVLGTHGQRGDRDLLAVGLLLELQRLLDGVLVELGEQTGDARRGPRCCRTRSADRQSRRGRTSHRRQCSWWQSARGGPS